MPFKSILQEWTRRVPGALGAILVDWEGEAVDQVGRLDPYDLKVIGAHKGLILDQLRKAVERADGNELQEITISTSKYQTLIIPVDAEYCLVLTLEKGDVLGLALFEARRCRQKVRREIA